MMDAVELRKQAEQTRDEAHKLVQQAAKALKDAERELANRVPELRASVAVCRTDLQSAEELLSNANRGLGLNADGTERKPRERKQQAPVSAVQGPSLDEGGAQ